MRRSLLLIAPFLCVYASADLTPFKPSESELRQLYTRSNQVYVADAREVLNWNMSFTWINNRSFWYRNQTSPTTHEFIEADISKGDVQKKQLFNHEKFASELSKLRNQDMDDERLNVNIQRVTESEIRFGIARVSYVWDRKAETIKQDNSPQPTPIQRGGGFSPDRKFQARLQDGKLLMRENKEGTEFKEVGSFEHLARISWSPDSQFLAVQSQIPGDRRQVSVMNSSRPDATRALLQTRFYDQPGDKLDTSETFVWNASNQKVVKMDHEPIICGGQPWAGPTGIQWWKPEGQDSYTFLIDEPIRGYQQHRVLEFDPISGKRTVWVDEIEETFIHTSQMFWRRMPRSKGLIFRSERNDWGQLFHYHTHTGITPLTKTGLVVRGLEHLTEEYVIFRANGHNTKMPYDMSYFKTEIPSGKTIQLCQLDGYQEATFSPDFKHFVVKLSSIDEAPEYYVYNSEGKQLRIITKSNASTVRDNKYKGAQPFVAKGRDGETDIHGIIHFPSHFDVNKSYPVIEDIYAGPHDSHVPKTFRPIYYQQRLAELGFIVVQIDGMGTANRGKEFHDVCWKNIADAGFPDRIAWMKSAAEKYPQMDLTRVGIYGTSAGGQNSTGALLFHPEFYKVAVSSCGCHDNRIDKYWWNEQWMGYPVGDHYHEQSNITNAAKLQGDLLLMVGEVDSNVPPESTFKLVDALVKANKEFEFVYLPGYNHTAGGQFGERKRRDFFVKHLLGVEPPNWNDD